MLIYDINPNDQTASNPAGRQAPTDPMRGEPMIPSGATDIKPPKPGKNEAARWTGEAWELVPDHRGREYWLPDGTQHEITELGETPPDDALDSAPPTPLDQLAANKRRAIDAARDTAINAGFLHNFGETADTVQTDTRDRENITGLAVTAQLLLASGDSETTLPFRAASDATYQLTAPEIVALALAAQQHVSTQYATAWALKDQLEAAVEADDRDGIEAIGW